MATQSSENDLFDRLCQTVAKPGIDSKVVQAAVLQLVGGRKHTPSIGTPIRGDIHLAVVADANVNLSRFLTGLEALISESGTAHLNGTNTTHSGAIGSTKNGSLTPGPFLDSDTTVSYVEQAETLDTRVTDALLQILDSGRYSFTKHGYRSTVDAPGGVFLGATPPNGSFDDYEPLSAQVPIPAKVAKATDLVVMNRSDADGFDSSADSLPVERARELLMSARSIQPTLTANADDAIDAFVSDYRSAIANVGVDQFDNTLTFGPERLEESARRLAEAHAKARLEERVTTENTDVVIGIFKDAHSDLGLEFGPDRGTFDGDIVETDTKPDLLSDDEEQQQEAMKEMVSDLELESDRGAPLDRLVNRTMKLGLSQHRTEELLDELMQLGEVYEPSTDHYRTT